MNWSFNLYFLTSEFFLVSEALLLLIFGVLISSSSSLGFPITSKVFYWLTSWTLLGGLILVWIQPTLSVFIWNSLLVSNFFSVNAKLFLFLVSFGSLLISKNYLIIQKLHFFEFWILFILTIVSLAFIIQAADLLTIYISIEFQSLIFYILASLNRNSEFSTESGLKYFILGAFASAFLLCGSVLVYHLTGLTNLNGLSKLLTGIVLDDPQYVYSLLLGIFFILGAFLFKLNVAPFHFWAPDVYEGAPLATTAIFAFLPKLAITSLFLKFALISLFDFFDSTQLLFIICCFSSALIGFFGAFSQIKWKRFVAYSSIGHASFLSLGFASSDLQSINNIIFFLIVYSISSVLLFLILTSFQYYQFPKIYQVRFITQVKSLTQVNNVLALFLLILMFSFAGIPPLAGFFSKLLIILTALKTSLVGLTILLILLNCFASFYYIRFTKLIYFDNVTTHLLFVPVTKGVSLSMTLIVFVLCGLFLEFDFFIMLTKLMTLSLIL